MIDLTTALWIALAGAVGSVARWLLSNLVQRGASGTFPVGTLTVNLLGSALIGVVMAWAAARGVLDGRARLVITAGFLGGFTTYSAFAYDTVTLFEKRAFGHVAAYLTATIVGCALACAGGIALVRALVRLQPK